MTPTQLADELRISPKTLRAFLRKRWPRPEHEKHQPWVVTPSMASIVRLRFR